MCTLHAETTAEAGISRILVTKLTTKLTLYSLVGYSGDLVQNRTHATHLWVRLRLDVQGGFHHYFLD